MSPHRRTTRAVAAWATFVLTVAVLVSPGTTSILPHPRVVVLDAQVRPAASAITVLVTVSDALRFAPDQISASPGAPIVLTVEQLGTIGHTFTLSSLSTAAGGMLSASETPSQVYAFVRAHPPTLNLSIPATTGGKVRATFTAPATGIYEFFCTVPSHFQSGMHGFLYSGVAPPSSGSNNTAAQGEFLISGGILVLVVIGISLGFVIGRRRGSIHEMPPERLGYPETPPVAPPTQPPAQSGPWGRRP